MSAPRKEITKDLVVSNKLGVHARPSAMFVKIASKYESDIYVEKDGERVNGKSLLNLLGLVVEEGQVVHLEVSGPDCEQALLALVEVLQLDRL